MLTSRRTKETISFANWAANEHMVQYFDKHQYETVTVQFMREQDMFSHWTILTDDELMDLIRNVKRYYKKFIYPQDEISY